MTSKQKTGKQRRTAFEIFAWISPPPAGAFGQSEGFNTPERFQEVAECGIGTVIDCYDRYRPDLPDFQSAAGLTSAENASRAGVRYLVADGGLSSLVSEQPDSDVRRFCGDILARGAAGHNVYDEPGVPGVEKRPVEKIYRDLGRLKKSYEKLFPGKLFYVNLLPRACTAGRNYWNDFENCGREEYETFYVESFIREVEPEFLSFDQYNLLAGEISGDLKLMGENSSRRSAIWTGYLENLEIFAKLSKKYGIPFFAYVQVAEHWAGRNRHIRYPRRQDIRFQIGCQLAYGSSGVAYFTYWQAADIPGYGPGCLDGEGHRTKHFDDVKALNEELQFLAQYYFDFEWMGVIAVRGQSGRKNPDFDLLEYSLSGHRGILGVECSEDTLVGVFENGERNAYLFVNETDPFCERNDEINVTFRSDISAASMIRNGTRQRAELEDGTLRVTLLPGEYVFVMPE